VSSPIKTWTWGQNDNQTSISETFTYTASRNNSYRLKLLTTERFKNTIGQCVTTESQTVESLPSDFFVDAPPARPTGLSLVTGKDSGGAPVITVKWKANSEPDIKQYSIQRNGPDGDVPFSVSPKACAGGWCKLTDGEFAGTGYEGTYSYTVIAYRNSVVSSDECSGCIGSAASSPASAKLAPPPPPPPSGGSGGSGSGSGGSGGSSNGGSSGGGSSSGGGLSSNGGAADPAAQGLSADGGAPAPVTSGPQLPGGGNASEFFTGEYSTRLPYQDRTLLVDGARETREKTRVVASGPTYADSINALKMLIPIAGGLLFITLAAHARRMLRDR
jgi:uncharacterized membrane protein YgcG